MTGLRHVLGYFGARSSERECAFLGHTGPTGANRNELPCPLHKTWACKYATPSM
jgi:hypothetical protein